MKDEGTEHSFRAKKRTMTRAEFEFAYGTPAEFEQACEAAYADLFINKEEMKAAIEAYGRDWKECNSRESYTVW